MKRMVNMTFRGTSRSLLDTLVAQASSSAESEEDAHQELNGQVSHSISLPGC